MAFLLTEVGLLAFNNGLAFLAASLLVIWLPRSNSRLIPAFQGAAARFGIRQWNHLIEKRTGDELRLRTSGFNLNESLEQRVAERTAQLETANRELAEVLGLNQKILAAPSLGIAAYRATGPCVLANQAFARTINATAEQAAQQNFYQISSWRKYGLLPVAEKALATGSEQRQEFYMVTTFGRELWMDCTFIPFSSGGEPHLLLLLDDITGRKQAEIALRASEQRYRGLFENMVEGYAYCQMIYENGQACDWIYLGINDAFQALTGLKDVVGKRVSEVIPALRETDPGIFDIYARVALTGRSEKFESFVEALQKWFSVSVYSQMSGFFVTVFDVITERKQAEQVLRENEMRSRELSVTSQRQAQELRLLDEVRIAISQELNLSVILHSVVEAIANTFEYQLVSLYLIQCDRLVLQHQVGYEQTIPEIPLGRGISSKAVFTGKPILVENVHDSPAFLGAVEGIVSEIAVPLFQQDKVVGVLNVESTRDVELTQKDVDLLMALSKNINIAFQRAQLYQAEHEQRILAEALADTAEALTSTPHLHEVFDRILANVGRVVAHENANIMLVEDGVAYIVDGLGYSEQDLAAARSIRLRVAETPNLQSMRETGQPLIVPDTHLQASWVDVPESRWIRSYAGAPIQVKGRTVGFINLNTAIPGFYTESHAQRLLAFAHQAAVAVENAQLYAQIQQQAITDELTGVYNRRGLFELGQREVERAVRYGHPLAALILDIDHFKAVNDTYGHPTGDQVLQLLTQCCLDHIRKIDIFGRYGGEEFVLLLPDSPSLEAGLIGERLRELVAAKPFPTRSGDIHITISLGATSVKEPGEDLASLIGRADRALYNAKQSGRNRLVSL